MLVLNNAPITLGDYEKQVILELDNELTLQEANKLSYNSCIVEIFFSIISDFYNRNRTTIECAAALHNLSKSVVIPRT